MAMINNKQIQCLNRLIKFTSCYETILDFLEQEKVITKEDLHRGDKDQAFHLLSLIEKGKKDESLLLVAYEWTLLPTEHINVTMTSRMMTKEFIYNEP